VPLAIIADAYARDHAVKNTEIVYSRIEKEWEGYCTYINTLDHHAFPLLVTPDKLADFLFYHSFRPRQKTGGVNGGGRGGERKFDPEEYENVKREYQEAFQLWKADPKQNPMPDPKDGGIGISAIMQYRAAMKAVFNKQVDNNCNTLSWQSQVWSNRSRKLVKIVEDRKSRVDRAGCKEKVNKEFAGYHAIEQYENIEREFWDGSSDNSMKKAFPSLRNRMMFLYTTSGVLRCESLMRAELSDFQGLEVKKETDIDPLYVMISQIPEGTFSRQEYADST